VLVAGLVDAPVFLAHVEVPVGVEVAVAVQGAELEDGFGAVQAHRAPVMSSRSRQGRERVQVAFEERRLA
jgi:hypothetical protein